MEFGFFTYGFLPLQQSLPLVQPEHAKLTTGCNVSVFVR